MDFPFGPAIRGMRLHQWVKNVLVFVPLVLGGKASDPVAWRAAFVGFIAFGLTASGTYLINDILDLPHDRLHPTKRNRPLASGALSTGGALAAAAALVSAGCLMAGWLGYELFLTLIAYVILTLSYSLWIKKLALFDIVAIASLFSLRLVFGVLAVNVRWSPWLLVLSMCSFASLVLAKRFAELADATNGGTLAGRGYRESDIPFVRGLGLATATTSVLIMIIYLIAEAFPHETYAHPERLWVVPVALFLFFGRIWLAAERREMDDDPVIFALRDRTCLVCGLSLAIAFASAVR